MMKRRKILGMSLWLSLCVCFVLSTVVPALAMYKNFSFTNNVTTAQNCTVYMYFQDGSRDEFGVSLNATVIRQSSKCVTGLSGDCLMSCSVRSDGSRICTSNAITYLSGLLCTDARYEIKLPSGSVFPAFYRLP